MFSFSNLASSKGSVILTSRMFKRLYRKVESVLNTQKNSYCFLFLKFFMVFVVIFMKWVSSFGTEIANGNSFF